MARFNPDAPLVTTNVVRLTIQSHGTAGLFETSIDYMSSVLIPNPGTAMVALGVAWRVANEANFLATLGLDVTVDGYLMQDISGGIAPSSVVPGVLGAGTVAIQSESSNLAVTVSKLTGLRGQHGRGRQLLGPIPATFRDITVDTNRIDAAAVTAYSVFLNNIYPSSIVAGGASWVPVVSTRPTPPATLVSRAAPVSGYVLRTIMGTCRRRRVGRGQ